MSDFITGLLYGAFIGSVIEAIVAIKIISGIKQEKTINK